MLTSLLAFTAAAILIVLLPGPDTLVVLRNLVRGGPKVAARTVAGVLSGLSVWVVTAALGLSAVLQASHDAYLGLRIAGACYLVVLGIRSLASRGEAPLEPTRGAGLLRTGYPAGLLTDLLNPKVGVFFVTFLPGFVPHHERRAGRLVLRCARRDLHRLDGDLLRHLVGRLGPDHALDRLGPRPPPHGPLHRARADRLRAAPGARALIHHGPAARARLQPAGRSEPGGDAPLRATRDRSRRNRCRHSTATRRQPGPRHRRGNRRSSGWRDGDPVRIGGRQRSPRASGRHRMAPR